MPEKPPIQTLLSECCEQAVACQLHLLHSGRQINAELSGVRPGRIILGLVHGTDPPFPETLCCVSFPYQKFLHAFLGCVEKVRESQSGIEVYFEIPTSIVSTNLRRSYRVPVLRDAGVGLTLVSGDGSRMAVELLNLSEIGAEVNLPGDDDRIAAGDEVQVELTLRTDHLNLNAIVLRRDHCRRALQFRMPATADRRNCVVTLQHMVRALEQTWLKNHLV